MKKFFNLKKFYINIILVCFIVYAIFTFISQQTKLNSYSESQAYYNQKITESKKEQEKLNNLKENVNSKEYIEQMAREKLDMFLPNERVFVDISQ